MAVLFQALNVSSGGFGNYRYTQALMSRVPPLRKAIRDDPKAKTVQERALNLGPNPRTDNEMRAAWYAYHVTDVGQKLQEYVKDFDRRMQTAAEAHAKAFVPPPPPPTMPPPTPVPLTGRAALKAAKETVDMANSLSKFARKTIDETVHMMHESVANTTDRLGEHIADKITQSLAKYITPPPPPPINWNL